MLFGYVLSFRLVMYVKCWGTENIKSRNQGNNALWNVCSQSLQNILMLSMWWLSDDFEEDKISGSFGQFYSN